ncbi:glyceraldehyde-3-phosphate dehydrogenase [Mycoplasmopsis cynos]|uniref:glyceraldehyde-3-phosphate dehydrogenase n=1 Tax=Mycoplasmopsis cynos TaxID=171284 RepID=UPI0024C91678|nr:glyceraldehyde-3-phosphate dehydrogenase [Mycoplasmopsis cynos]WAM09879.1 glyceraldehyde-3-phosphate dehydrogenase [Mycoplasmopsis cynos]
MTTVHAYTGDQRLQDAPHRDLRRARAAAQKIWRLHQQELQRLIGLVVPERSGKLDGIAVRVPLITGSLVDLTVFLEKQPTVEEVNAAMKKVLATESFKYLTDPIVSSDIINSSYGSLFDSLLTTVKQTPEGNLYKLFSRYDNEMSYVSQLIRTTVYFANLKK